jgi:hypothetical protein
VWKRDSSPSPSSALSGIYHHHLIKTIASMPSIGNKSCVEEGFLTITIISFIWSSPPPLTRTIPSMSSIGNKSYGRGIPHHHHHHHLLHLDFTTTIDQNHSFYVQALETRVLEEGFLSITIISFIWSSPPPPPPPPPLLIKTFPSVSSNGAPIDG